MPALKRLLIDLPIRLLRLAGLRIDGAFIFDIFVNLIVVDGLGAAAGGCGGGPCQGSQSRHRYETLKTAFEPLLGQLKQSSHVPSSTRTGGERWPQVYRAVDQRHILKQNERKPDEV
ncbi:hypothetical protein ACJ72_04444 [Emergomyces africanus]|uniref:Uncharacterized protein n=1 Tax=Emergomyces africanus TaxID=1955775 RepID=A0A1B7NWQ5_9EURO|nr:hypothetical protein ACJ72_04444 [Emergomyces africanus]